MQAIPSHPLVRTRGIELCPHMPWPRSRRADHWSAALLFICFAPLAHLAVPWKAYRAAEGSPIPAGVGRLCLPVGGCGSGLPAVWNRKGRHPEELKPTKDPGGAGSDSGVSIDIRTAPPSLP